ncbi:MAG: hypothetical protein MJY60_07060, partial [Bacteroidales bacterium]|nr:hypothetical protein [Bacteroidales bacterium]
GKNKSRSIIEVLEDSELGANALPDLSGKAITIIGNGHTWDVSERTLQIATDEKTDVKIEGLIIDGKDVVSDKRFYYNTGILTLGLGTELKNLTFEQPVSNAVCGVICNDGGGIINIDGAYIHDIMSRNATESGNCHGGFISNFKGTVNMTGGTVENLSCEGTGEYGGSFIESQNSGCAVNITGASFKNCKANIGGVINCQTGTLNLANSSFTNCSGKKGGAIFFNGKGTITNTKFTNCTATDLGGAIRVNGTATQLTITDCTISDCASANNAGAISATAGVINVNGNTSILNCTATTYGGGIHLDTSAKMNISGNTKIDACKSTRGGAIFTAHSANVSCTISENVTISNCIAEVVNKTNWGGGAIWAASKFEIKGGRFINNTIKTTAGQQLYGAVLTSGTGANAAVTISGGVFISDINASMLCTADKGATMSVTGGTFVNLNQGASATIFTCAFTYSIKPVMKGGYFNKQFNKWVDYTGYQLVDNPQATAADQAAYAEGATLKLVAK